MRTLASINWRGKTTIRSNVLAKEKWKKSANKKILLKNERERKKNYGSLWRVVDKPHCDCVDRNEEKLIQNETKGQRNGALKIVSINCKLTKSQAVIQKTFGEENEKKKKEEEKFNEEVVMWAIKMCKTIL